MYGYDGYPSYGEFDEGFYPSYDFFPYEYSCESLSQNDLGSIVEALVIEFVGRHVPLPPPRPLQPWSYVGWSQPPRPADVIVSFDPKARMRDQARAVLYDYYHDTALRSWADNEAVKRCFGVKTKEDHDPLAFVAAFENQNHKVWKCQGGGMTWKEMRGAVQQAIARRKKLGPLPKSTYDKYPLVLYYYDDDYIKKITYPGPSVPVALNPQNNRWWDWSMGDQSDAGKDAGMDKIHVRISNDPKQIQAERDHPGWVTKAEKTKLKERYPWLSNMEGGSAGDWGDEGFDWDRDVAGTGLVGSITGAILALVSAVLDITGVGAVIGVPLGIATPFIVAAINAADTALHTGDFGNALGGLGTAMIQAATSAASKGTAQFNIPPAAVQAVGSTVSNIAKDVIAGQQKKLDFGQIWGEVAKKAGSYGKLGDDEVEAIATMLGGPGGQGSAAGHVFIQGYLAGKFLDMPALQGIAKILTGYATFADPRIINIALLGMGMGFLTKAQQGKGGGTRKAHATRGEFDSVGQIFMRADPREDLAAFIHLHLKPRYGLGYREARHFTGFACPEGYDLVASDHEIACAYRKKAACLAGFTNERGMYVCSDWDYPPCPPGMGNVSGSPKNWCFPHTASAVHGFFTGQAPPPPPPPLPTDYGPLSRGCPQGHWWDPLSGACRPAEPLPARHAAGFGFDPHYDHPWDISRRALHAAAEGYMAMPGPFQFGYKLTQEFLG